MVAISVKEDEASINPANKADSETINPGETVEITVATSALTEEVDVYLGGTAVSGGSDIYGRIDGPEVKLGTASPDGPSFKVFHYTPQKTGTLNAYTSNTWGSAVNATVEPGSGSGGVQNDTAFTPEEESDALAGDDSVDPSNYAGIVNADNDEGIALAPALRREGASLGPEGGTVTLPDGDTVEVGAISESDEVARYLDGQEAGEVVDADQGAVSDPTANGSGGGMIGAAVAAVVLLVAGGAALLGGDS